MASLLVDSPPDSQGEQSPPNGSAVAQAPAASAPDSDQPAGSSRSCASCGAQMAPGQEWCLRCGAGAPGSLARSGWRSAATVLAATAVLVLGAVAAAYAALSHRAGKSPVVTTTVAQVPAPTASVPATTATAPAGGVGGVPIAPGGVATTPTVKGLFGLGAVKPPKIPLTAATPKGSSTTPITGVSPTKTKVPTTTTTTPSTHAGKGTGGTGEASQPTAILLDTNAAQTYNPYALPATEFGDPSLAIDGDPSTAWTAQVDPASAPSMAEGVLIDLKSKQKVSALELVTSTPGMTVQVYGTESATAPTSITDPAWIPLSRSRVVKKKHAHIALRDSKKAFAYLTLWISRAPTSAIGTPAAPGHVDVNEIELFPA
ncbi:MAG TPA: hypothetical protein VK272_08340 [Solirubrobacteraceae bacterium]|nr:hypothetical protein [Solirubrobacteraceae bacterium]